jgi:protein phosphatase
MTTLSIPKLSLVVMIGASGSGKSTFAKRHFLATEVLSSDVCRGLVSDDENNQAATGDAFELLHAIAAKRLERGRLTVIDATNVQAEARAPLVQLARQYHCLPVAIVLDPPEHVCYERNRSRSDRAFGSHVIRQQKSQLRRAIKSLKREGFRHIFVLRDDDELEAAAVERVPLWNDRTAEHGPFDIIGDVHGCATELEALLALLGYQREAAAPFIHPAGRKAVFLGDLVDRGPRVLDVLAIVRGMVDAGAALCVPGNHDMKLLKKLRGKDVQITHGLAQTLAEIDALADEMRAEYCRSLAEFLDGLVSHYVLDSGRLVVAHAGMKEAMQGRGSGRVRDFALYGETTGETDEFGLPIRYNWAAEYRGAATVVYGHTPVPQADWLNNTVNIDTGCVFGGKLTALRYPENEFVSVGARHAYCEPVRPFLPVDEQSPALSAQQADDDMLDAADVLGKRIVTTRLHQNVTIRQENATAALEVMSRFAANPKWLVYLPPTMSPCETSHEGGLLEHPAQALAYFRNLGVPRAICEEKHMGSRAVVIVCRDDAAARERFGVTGESGIVYTRTGRRFFPDAAVEGEVLARVRSALDASGFWDEFSSTWACLDCELMPWSAKAQELLRAQYAAVGAAGRAALPSAEAALANAATRMSGEALEALRRVQTEIRAKAEGIEQFVAAYRHYCWPVESVDDLRLAPFHLLATEGAVHTHRNHMWHMATLARICACEPRLLVETPIKLVDLSNAEDEEAAIAWWQTLTARGGEGMVVKPLEFIVRSKKGLVQPAVKCRGPEYLRIIYGPDYDRPENLARLRNRGLAGKRSLALREFALGVEALERFVRREPLRRVHECVFGVLALESEPVDPRL